MTLAIIFLILLSGALLTLILLAMEHVATKRRLTGQLRELDRELANERACNEVHLAEIEVITAKKDELRDLNGSLEASLRTHRMYVDQVVHFGETLFGHNSASFRMKTLELTRTLFPILKVPK